MVVCGIVGDAEGMGTGDRKERLADRLRDEIGRLAAAGVKEFAVSMDDGVGLLAANLVLRQKRNTPQVRLTCLLLWEEQAADWPEHVRDRWFNTIAKCDREELLETRRSPENLEKRDRWLRENCDGLLAVWDGGASPVWRTAAAAHTVGMPVVEVRTE